MVVKLEKFIILVIITTVKLMGGLLYYFNQTKLGLDYINIFQSYCTKNINYDNNTFKVENILNYAHKTIFSKFCFLDINIFFFIFLFFQTILLILVFSKFYDLFKGNLFRILLILILFISPTISFFSSAPTKDGFFLLFILISIYLIKYIPKYLILLPLIIKPYFVFLYFSISKLGSLFIFLIINAYLYFFGLYEKLFTVFEKKNSFFSFQAFLNLSHADIIWLSEILSIFIVSLFFKQINKKLVLMTLFLSIFAAGLNLNVGSRIFSLGIFYMVSMIYLDKTIKTNRESLVKI